MTSARSITISCRSRPLTGLFQASVTFTSARRRLMSVLIRLGDGGSLVLDTIIWLDTDLLKKHHCHRCWVTSGASITAHWLDNDWLDRRWGAPYHLLVPRQLTSPHGHCWSIAFFCEPSWWVSSSEPASHDFCWLVSFNDMGRASRTVRSE
jgi:hypothetical protein